jgi:hypothetical protein
VSTATFARADGLALAADRFAIEKPLAWASRQLAEEAALSALGLGVLAVESSARPCRGRDDRFGGERHLESARALAVGGDVAVIGEAQRWSRAASAAPPIPLGDALAHHFAFDVRFEFADAAEGILDAAALALRRRLVRSGTPAAATLRSLPPLALRNNAPAFLDALGAAVATTAERAGLRPRQPRFVDGGTITARMWRRWFVVDGQVVYVLDNATLDAAPQDFVWRFVHDAAHLAHLGDLADAGVGTRAGDAPFIGILEGFAMLAEAAQLGLVDVEPFAAELPVASELVELELLHGFVERAVRFAAEVRGDYSASALEALAERSGLSLETVVGTVLEWRGLTGMGSCYLLGLLAAAGAARDGALTELLRFELAPPTVRRADVDALVSAFEALR